MKNVTSLTFTLIFVLIALLMSKCSPSPQRVEEKIDVSINFTNYQTVHITNTNYTTNYITNNITNTTNYTTNYVDNIVTNGPVFFNLSKYDNDIIQPYWRVYGKLEGGFTSNALTYMGAYVTNSSTQFDAIFTSPSNFYIPLVTQGYQEVFVYFSSVMTNNSTYTIGINLFVSNIPYVRITNISTDQIITPTNVSIAGIVEVSQPDTITSLNVVLSNSSGVTTNSISFSSYTTWTNKVNGYQFSHLLNLGGGFNYVKVIAQSSANIYSESQTIVILKSLFQIDGLYETFWNSAKLLASSSTPNPYFGYGIANVRITNDSYFLYIFVSNLNVPNLGVNGLKLSIAIDTNSTSGISNDAWIATNSPGRFVFAPTNGKFPDIEIQFRLKNTNEINGAGVYLVLPSTQTWTNVANTWVPNYQNGSFFGVNNKVGWEIAVPLSLIGITNNTSINLVAILGKPDGDNKNSAIHVLPESPSNEITTNDGYFTNHIRVYASNYIISF